MILLTPSRLGDARDTLPGRFFANAKQFADRVVHRYRDGGYWFPVGWSTAANLIRHLASGLMALGHQPSDPVAIAAGARREFVYCDLAVLTAGGISVVIPTTADRATIGEILAHSEVGICIVENRALLDKIAKCGVELPALRHLVVIDDSPASPNLSPDRDRGLARGAIAAHVQSYRQFLNRGRSERRDVAGRLADLGSLDAAMFLYEPGPAPVMLTHGNLAAAMTALEALRWGPEDCSLALMPLSHGMARVVEHYALWVGMQTTYPERQDGPPARRDDLGSTPPTVLIAVPSALEQIVREVYDEVARSPAGQRLFTWASDLALESARSGRDRDSIGPGFSARFGIARRLIFRLLADRLGGAVHTIAVIGGPCGHGVGELFGAAGIRVITLSGSAETYYADCVATGGAAGARPLPGVEIALADDGEILIRSGGVFSGYYKAEADTAAAFTRDGFVRTGNLAQRTRDGTYHMLGPKRDAVVLESGQRIMPAAIEAWMRGDPRLEQVVVVRTGPPLFGRIALDFRITAPHRSQRSRAPADGRGHPRRSQRRARPNRADPQLPIPAPSPRRRHG